MRLGYPALGEAQTAPAAPPHGKRGGRAGVSAGEPQDRCASGGSEGDAEEEAYWRRMYAEYHPDPAPLTAVLPTKEGHPNWGAPLVWVCGYRCGTLTCGWMSTTHPRWPKSVGILIAEATLIGVLTAVAAWAEAAKPTMAAAIPLAATAAIPNL